MGILAKHFNTTLVNIAHRFYIYRDDPKNVKTGIIRENGVQKFLFILEYLDFYHYWELILLNEPPLITSTSTS